MTDLPVGTMVNGRYELVDVLGTGGFATVYRAVDHRRRDRVLAVKIPVPDMPDEFRDRFALEAQAMARFDSPTVARIYDWGPWGLAMAYYPDGTLWDLLSNQDGRVDYQQLRALCRDTLDALALVHSDGTMHRDVKPQNIMVDGDRFLLADFGLVRAASSRLTKAGVRMGTLVYMAPEQLLGAELDPAADLYALGVVLYLSVSGRLPFDTGDIAELVNAQRQGAPKLVDMEGLVATPELCGYLDRLLSFDKADRWAAAAELAVCLSPARAPHGILDEAGGTEIVRRPAPPAPQPAPPAPAPAPPAQQTGIGTGRNATGAERKALLTRRQQETRIGGGSLTLAVRVAGASAQWLTLDMFPCTIGRDAGCDLALPDPTVSSLHAIIRHTATGFRLQDEGSTNGVVVGGERVDAVDLVPGLRAGLGDSELTVS